MKQIKTKRNLDSEGVAPQSESLQGRVSVPQPGDYLLNHAMDFTGVLIIGVLVGLAISSNFMGEPSQSCITPEKYSLALNQSVSLQQQLNQTQSDAMKIVSVATIAINQTRSCVADFNNYQKDVSNTLCSSPGFEINCANNTVSWRSTKVV